MTEKGVWRYTAALLCLSLLGGAWLRLSGLAARSITHPEMYVPGIPLPDGLSEPAERVTVSRILTGTFSSDTHPPGYYLVMLPWTRIMGTSLRSIRLPSAFFGIACIPLVFWLGSLTGWRVAGALAAALLAFSGYLVFWSQVARMFAWNCFLGLTTTVLLLLIARGSRRQALLITAYTILILAGVASHVFFWSFFAAHIIWAFGNAVGRPVLPDICRAQLLTLALGSPLIAFAAYQSGNTVAELSSNILVYLAEFLPFAFALPTVNSGFFASEAPLTGNAAAWAVRGVLLGIAIFLLINGLSHLRQPAPKSPVLLKASPGRALWTGAWIAAGMMGTVAIAGFVYLSRQLPPEFVNSTIRITKLLSILPPAIAAAAVVLERIWPRLPQPGGWTRWIAVDSGLLLALAIIPLAALAVFAQFRPILNQRGLLFAAPYLLLLLAIGITELRPRAWIAALAPVLTITCVLSLRAYSGMMVDPADYAGFAADIQSEIRNSDLVFIRKAWYETPILYYLRKDRYRLVGRDFGAACASHPEARVWVVLLYDSDPAREMQSALAGYRSVKTIMAPHAKAILYEHGSV